MTHLRGKKKHTHTSSSASNEKGGREELLFTLINKLILVWKWSYYLHSSCKHTNMNKTKMKRVCFCLIPANPPVASLIPVMSTGLALPAARWEVLWLGTRTAHASLWSARRWLLPADSIIHTHTALSLSATKTSLASSLSARVGCIINCSQLSVLGFFSDVPMPSEACLWKNPRYFIKSEIVMEKY